MVFTSPATHQNSLTFSFKAMLEQRPLLQTTQASPIALHPCAPQKQGCGLKQRVKTADADIEEKLFQF